MDQEIIIIKKGPWTPEEDSILFNYVNLHGEGHWNFLARSAGLKRTGKSCRLRWLNYLRPNVRRGNITLQEQLLILHLHSRWGNRWAKIAEYLPGRTDNEIKNYWRTRVQKQAKQLNCDVNSQRFRDAMRFLWIPRLLERIRSTSPPENTSHSTPATMSSISTTSESSWWENPNMFIPNIPISGTETSSESSEVLTGSDVDLPISELDGGSGFNVEDFGSGWMDGDGVDSSLENLWTDENMTFLQDQLFD